MGNERWYRWYGASQAIASMLLLNGYWLLFNLPVLLLALGLIFPSSPRQFLFSLVGLIISFPSILLPATFALFGSCGAGCTIKNHDRPSEGPFGGSIGKIIGAVLPQASFSVVSLCCC